MVGAGVPHDAGDRLGMFFSLQRNSVHHLIDGDLPVRFESSTHYESLMMLLLLLQQHGDDAGSRWSSLCAAVMYTLHVVNGPNPVNCTFEKTLPGEFS